MRVCVHENRQAEEPALRLLLLSVARHSPKTKLVLFCSGLTQAFYDFAATFEQVEAVYPSFPVERHWNVKPDLLLHCIRDLGFKDVVWLDSDIIVTRELTQVFGQFSADVFLMAQETLWATTPDDNGAMRARGWGFDVGREHPFALNSCIIRATEQHTALLERWQDMQTHEDYVTAQKQPSGQRPAHLRGAQELLTALLCSKEFSDTKLEYLRLGRDVVHSYGLKAFPLRQRLQWMKNGPPPFVHSQRLKPWMPTYQAGGGWLNRCYEDTFPYLLLADKLGTREGENVGWARAKTLMGRLMRATSFGYPPLCGVGLAAAFDAGFGAARLIKTAMGRDGCQGR